MAKGVKTGGRDFKKGDRANPNGRPPDSPEIKALRSVTKERLKELMDILFECNVEQLEEIVKSNTEPSFRTLYAAGILRAVKEGNPGRIENVLNRILGKPKETVEHSGKLRLEDILQASNEIEDE